MKLLTNITFAINLMFIAVIFYLIINTNTG